MSKFVRRYLVRFLRYDRYMRLEASKKNLIYDSLDGLFYNIPRGQEKSMYLER